MYDTASRILGSARPRGTPEREYSHSIVFSIDSIVFADDRRFCFSASDVHVLVRKSPGERL